MAHYVYILYSTKLDRFYIGNTAIDPIDRLAQHNDKMHLSSFTAKGVPWVLFFVLDCTSRIQARKIEQHIKRMKSKKYIHNLKRYPEMQSKLKSLYS